MYALVLVLFLGFVRVDPPKFYVLTDQNSKANKAIQMVYDTNDGEEAKIESVRNFLQETSSDASQV